MGKPEWLPMEPVCAYELARRIAGFGARRQTIAMLSGLTDKEIERILPTSGLSQGRWPSAGEWYPTAGLIEKVEASAFAAMYDRNRKNGFDLPASLISAYGRYRRLIPRTPSVSFDRAVNLVAQLEGNVFGVAERSLELVECTACGSEYLAALGNSNHEPCVFERLQKRYPRDRRLQDHFRIRSAPL